MRDAAISVLLVTLIALCLLSLFIHSLTYFSYDPRKISLGLWYGLQLSSALAFMPGFIFIHRSEIAGRQPPLTSAEQVLGFCFVVFILYGFFNFPFTSYVLLHDATPEIVNGHYAIGSHGHFTNVTKEEFFKYQVYEARMNSGHWMAFYLLSVFGLVRKFELRGSF